ncbi:MAG: SCO family protein [Ignavibacteriales bacterium]|nr:MAG: SCO family protein [Ignavibacteriaceae bacterium]MBW7871910.1 SCO family protein [Ignavibacteria bacterium]MCZ2144240.1 SCO family protein [Ignavibacteriales bacterium]OQY73241.1 MAG: hypothetical protein B6D45_08325 [Ignavibacteriales bacterium UTCHB3]MBV6446193.1 SCO1 protein [Ignavibacteriaceae bacterium]
MRITKIFKIVLFPSFFTLFLLVAGCGEKFELNENLQNYSFSLVDQDGKPVNFPAQYKGKILVVGFIFTNCPDICPLTVNNMQKIQEEVGRIGAGEEVEFLAVSFDPERDSVAILKKFAEIREVNETNFRFLTGNKEAIDSLIKVMGIVAIPEDSTVVDNTISYYFTHTDRISLIDQDGSLRKEYSGSKIDTKEIIEDIGKLR